MAVSIVTGAVIVGAVSVVRRDVAPDDVSGRVVLEVRFTRHAARDVEQTGKRVVAYVGGGEGPEVPMVVAHECVEAERVRGEHDHHCA